MKAERRERCVHPRCNKEFTEFICTTKLHGRYFGQAAHCLCKKHAKEKFQRASHDPKVIAVIFV